MVCGICCSVLDKLDICPSCLVMVGVVFNQSPGKIQKNLRQRITGPCSAAQSSRSCLGLGCGSASKKLGEETVTSPSK